MGVLDPRPTGELRSTITVGSGVRFTIWFFALAAAVRVPTAVAP